MCCNLQDVNHGLECLMKKICEEKVCNFRIRFHEFDMRVPCTEFHVGPKTISFGHACACSGSAELSVRVRQDLMLRFREERQNSTDI